MKIKKNFILHKLVNGYVCVPVGETMSEFNGLININETGAFLWQFLENDVSREFLLSKLLEEYDVDKKTAQNGLDKFLLKLKENDILDGDIK